jgi:lipoprotein-releasing system permease protein
MFRPFFLFIGARYTNFKRRDHFITFISIVSMIGIALGVMVLITVLSVMNGFTKEIRSRILSVTPHVMVSGWGENLQDWHGLAETLSKHKSVEAVGPYVDGQGMLTRGREVKGIVVKGVDPNAIDAVFPLRSTLKAGSVDSLKEGSFNVILGAYLAKLLGVNIGDSVTLVIPEVTVSLAGVAPRLKRLTVVGIFEVGYIYDSGFAFMNIEDAAKIFKTQGGITGLQLRLVDPFSAPRIAKEIYEQTHGFYNVVDWTVLNSTYFSAVKMEKTMMFFTLIMILAIAVFNLVSTLVMIVTDKRADIGVLRALGASTRKIMAIFISQGAIIGFIGTILGILAGIALALHVTELVSALERTFHVKFLSADVYFISFLPSDLQTQDVLLIGICAMVLSLLATIHPAWRAANVQPAEALRHDA